MATVTRIPLRPNRPTQEVVTTLDGRRYRLRLDWLGRIQRWAISVYSSDGALLVGCRGLVLGSDVLRRSRHDVRVPQGHLYLEDLQGAGEEATLESLGVRHVLRFILLSEVE